jgi:hypothetical protein
MPLLPGAFGIFYVDYLFLSIEVKVVTNDLSRRLSKLSGSRNFGLKKALGNNLSEKGLCLAQAADGFRISSFFPKPFPKINSFGLLCFNKSRHLLCG